MILVDFATIQNENEHYLSAKSANGDLLICKAQGHEVVACKLKTGVTMVAYQKLHPKELRELESLPIFGGDAVAAGRLPFIWHYMKNDREWEGILQTFDSAGDIPAPEQPPVFNGHSLAPEDLAKVQPLRPDQAREQLRVKE